ncbi:MAG: UDP-N-acetylmuramoyl-tripeptide--D-alanyl-D-alanine ligase [Pseudomonadota bacterium]
MTGHSGLWTAYEAAAATGGALCARGGDPDRWLAEEWAASGISIDSRTLKPGEIFVALKDARDGHEFVAGAFDRGAAAALVDHAPKNAPDGKPLLLVGDTMQALSDLALAARQRNFGRRIAVTGSAGKTTTKEMLRRVFDEAGSVHAADRSFNNHLGVPLTLAQMPLTADYGVFEIGMNHAGEITPLAKLVQPDIAIITTVAAAHLENFGTVEKIAEAKAEILTGVGPGGACVLPLDNAHFDLLHARAEEAGIKTIVTFGEANGADVRLKNYETDGIVSRSEVEVFGVPVSFEMPSPGKHQAMNALAVFAAAHLAGVSLSATAAGLSKTPPAKGRGEQRKVVFADGRHVTVLDESYNANPASMQAALSLLGALTPGGNGRRIVVFGDMLELGDQAAALHESLADPLVESGVAKLYAAGPLSGRLFAKVPPSIQGSHHDNAAALAVALSNDLRDGDIVMVKGSNASNVSAVVRHLDGLDQGKGS